jgi:hypothetical protein
MADLTRNELERAKLGASGLLDDTACIPKELYVRLLDMASRCVSEDAVYMVKRMLTTGEKVDRADRVLMMNELIRYVLRDIGPAAEALKWPSAEGAK